MSEGDSVFRAMTDDGTFRVVTARTTGTVRGAIAAQNVMGEMARYFGDLVTGVVLIRGSGETGTMVADSHPSGRTRGLVTRPEGVEGLELGEGSLLRLMRTLH